MSKKQKPAGQGGRSGQRGSFDDGANLTAVPLKCQTRPDVFARAKEQYTVLDAWRMLGLPGEPTLGTNISPLREERRPSFSIQGMAAPTPAPLGLAARRKKTLLCGSPRH